MKRLVFSVFMMSLATLCFGQYGDYSVRVELAGNGFAHFTEIYFEDDAPVPTYGWDQCCDAGLLIANLNQPHVFTNVVAPPFPANNPRISINGLPHLFEPTDVPMGIRPGELAEYTFTFKELYTLPFGTTVELEDLALNVFQDLLADSIYTTWSAPSDDENRFIIHFNPFSVNGPRELEKEWNPTVQTEYDAIIISGFSTNKLKNVRVFDMYGRVVFEKETKGVENQFRISRSGLAKGSYIVEFESLQSQRNVVKITL